MRIRKKLIFLHTFFSLLLAAILVVALRPAVGRIVQEAEEHEARLVMSVLAAKLKAPGGVGPVIDDLRRGLPPEVSLAAGGIEALGLDAAAAAHAHASPGEPIAVLMPGRSPTVIVY
ncbi:MAG TPA: hypothetical protein VEB22_05230, partial [Phycisphaerales bacterium]|nr:hypothetical protein [Phycisphaerales bacterium]